MVQVDCAAIAPADQQCGTCLTTVIVRNATTVYVGFEGSCPTAGGGR